MEGSKTEGSILNRLLEAKRLCFSAVLAIHRAGQFAVRLIVLSLGFQFTWYVPER